MVCPPPARCRLFWLWWAVCSDVSQAATVSWIVISDRKDTSVDESEYQRVFRPAFCVSGAAIWTVREPLLASSKCECVEASRAHGSLTSSHLLPPYLIQPSTKRHQRKEHPPSTRCITAWEIGILPCPRSLHTPTRPLWCQTLRDKVREQVEIWRSLRR